MLPVLMGNEFGTMSDFNEDILSPRALMVYSIPDTIRSATFISYQTLPAVRDQSVLPSRDCPVMILLEYQTCRNIRVIRAVMT